jgi:hypothetical protein
MVNRIALQGEGGCRPLVKGAGRFLRLLPYFLKRVKVANFRAEDMDDHVAGVDQDPVRSGQAFDLGGAVTGFLQCPQQMIRNRAHMTMGTARCDHHVIGHRGFALDIDGNDVFGLGVFETFPDQFKDPIGSFSSLISGVEGALSAFFSVVVLKCFLSVRNKRYGSDSALSVP